MQSRDRNAPWQTPCSAQRTALTLTATLLLLAVEPALANKFETIGGGVSGSLHIKREWLITFLNIAGGISLFSAVLAVVVPRTNALYLNYSNWKQSAIVMLVIAGALFAGAALL
ncbi:MAG: hypothetical protein KDI82_11795 [Gammaproteobacteria bacterium]|nr:hypothetical protein [Gammaproteobacteria bacterium]